MTLVRNASVVLPALAFLCAKPLCFNGWCLVIVGSIEHGVLCAHEKKHNWFTGMKWCAHGLCHVFETGLKLIPWRLSDIIIYTMPRSAKRHDLSPCSVSVIALYQKKHKK